ncbi:MAG: energy transducer TonB [Opitutales bacterium]
MKLPNDQPFWTSVILHIVVLVALFLATIIETLKPKEKQHVFEIVTPPSEQSFAASPSPVISTPQVPIPELPPMPELMPIPEPVVQPAPPARPAPQRPAPVAPERRVLTEKEFRERFGAPQPRLPTRPTTQRQINPGDLEIDVPVPVMPTDPSPSATSPRPLTQQQMSALDSYSAQLRSRIDAAWSKPASLGGIRIAATVIFDVSASGRITNVRLNPRSGNSAFDQSVLAAFRKIVSAGPTPTGQGHSFTMTFRMRD